jgi:ectoine hydroxylase-related dioxygenase (phytanoyl-CoA dioxygenase family)
VAQQTADLPGLGDPGDIPTEGIDTGAIVDALYGDGITALRGAFPVEWVDDLARDVQVAFGEARSRPDGAVGRGPNRWYVEVHPEQLRGFVDLVSHPWVNAAARAVLGDDYHFVEVGFDVPLPGAVDQPWHRDFPTPRVTREERRLTSLAFNLTLVDTTPDMGPFEIAVGTQWDDSAELEHGMFAPKALYSRYEERAQRKLPQRGDISVRSALTIHRGTQNHSQLSRPVLVLGVEDGRDTEQLIEHSPRVTRAYWDSLPQSVKDRLHCPIVDEALVPITQKHTIEGLVMGAS